MAKKASKTKKATASKRRKKAKTKRRKTTMVDPFPNGWKWPKR